MRGIWITPDQEVLIQTVETNGSLRSIYTLLDCELIDTVRLNEHGDVMYVDDEGYMTKNYFFQLGQYPNPIAGRGLILGTDLNTGETIGTDLSFQAIAPHITPLTVQEAYRMAKEADAKARQQIKDEGREASTIFLSTSEIMEGAWYADQLEIKQS